MIPKRELNSIEDVITAWAETNATTTERSIDSANVGQSDSINASENIFRSMDIRDSKNVLFSEGATILSMLSHHHARKLQASVFGLKIVSFAQIALMLYGLRK